MDGIFYIRVGGLNCRNNGILTSFNKRKFLTNHTYYFFANSKIFCLFEVISTSLNNGDGNVTLNLVSVQFFKN